jgi:hypothetical protein
MEDIKKVMKIDDIKKYEDSAISYLDIISNEQICDDCDEETSCAICLALIKPENEKDYEKKQFISLSCNHIFHNNCILHWFTNYNYICPLCKKECGEYKMKL